DLPRLPAQRARRDGGGSVLRPRAPRRAGGAAGRVARSGTAPAPHELHRADGHGAPGATAYRSLGRSAGHAAVAHGIDAFGIANVTSEQPRIERLHRCWLTV